MAKDSNGKCARDILVNYIAQWCAFFNRKPDTSIGDSYLDLFANEDPEILQNACAVLSITAERFPIPRMIKNAIDDARETSKANRISFRLPKDSRRWTVTVDGSVYSFAGDPDGEKFCTGIQPAPPHQVDRDFSDADGTPCWFDRSTGEMRYVASDCAEGKEFLANLKRVAQSKTVPFERPPSERELERRRLVQQQQAAALLPQSA